MWAFFFVLFDFPEIALLLGALAVYWSISALRAKPKDASAPGTAGASGATATTGSAAAGSTQSTPGTTPGSPLRAMAGSRPLLRSAVW